MFIGYKIVAVIRQEVRNLPAWVLFPGIPPPPVSPERVGGILILLWENVHVSN
jgi:hypothetical protein